MSSAIDESTPMNYEIKVENGFNIPEIDLVNNGDTISFNNMLSAPLTLGFCPELSGFVSVTIAPKRCATITVTDAGGVYAVSDLSILDLPMQMTIKMGGRVDRSRRTTEDARPRTIEGGGEDGE